VRGRRDAKTSEEKRDDAKTSARESIFV